MRPLRVWYNENLSSTYNVVRLLRSVPEAVRPHVVCTHRNPDFPAFEVSDQAALEPRGLNPDDYLAFCLEFCRREAVDVFVPGQGMARVAAAGQEFRKGGTSVVVAADPETMHLFDDKARFYRTVPARVAEAPAFRIVNSADRFTEACGEIAADGSRVCFKPSRSTGGLGFHILDDRQTELRSLFKSEPVRVSTAAATRILSTERNFRDLLVMEYLDGAEYSVDCLALPGRLLRAVARRKPTRVGGAQLLEDREDLVAIARRATEHYLLDGVFNVQMRFSGGRPKLLEINPRMSGGLYFSCLSGVNFPFWAVQLAAGRADEAAIPQPRTGLRVQQQLGEFVLENAVSVAPDFTSAPERGPTRKPHLL